MHIEIQVALNFVISYLYNKLPRRRVNLFGEELERAIKHKFDGHWYPEKPFKGSAYRCLRIGSPIDPVLETAARESGVELPDIRENLPEELSVWIDPGEVSYRIGEKGVVKILYAASADDLSSLGHGHNGNHHHSHHHHDDVTLLDREVTRSFNPEAQCFKPIVEAVATSLGSLSVHVQSSPNHVTTGQSSSSSSNSPFGGNSPTSPSFKSSTSPVGGAGNGGSAVAPAIINGSGSSSGSSGGGGSSTAAFLPNSKSVIPLTFTTATFAQTKFGSTKLKTNSKRSNRMSPTEFSNYIKQRALLQQQTHVPPPGLTAANGNSAFFAPVQVQVPPPGQQGGPSSPQPPQRPRSLSPINPQHDQHFRFMATSGNGQQQHLRGLFDSGYLGDLFSANATNNGIGQHLQQQQQQQQQVKYPSALNGGGLGTSSMQTTDNSPYLSGAGMGINDNSKTLLDGINFNLNTMPYPNQHQHLLVAN